MNSPDAVHTSEKIVRRVEESEASARVVYILRAIFVSDLIHLGQSRLCVPTPFTVIRCPGTTRCPRAMGVSQSHFCTPAAIEMDGGLLARTGFVFNSCPLLFSVAALPCAGVVSPERGCLFWLTFPYWDHSWILEHLKFLQLFAKEKVKDNVVVKSLSPKLCSWNIADLNIFNLEVIKSEIMFLEYS
ncbi:hypothetical protein AVEN_189532-1 [Araneus ventricosus]|uniref:Uncharacterized protein n=1 Tax=Araneus ventricosus TaxID=182803 RepID=A0A4Y2GPN3_ARAVE|nr:hypothetical protein AVEN_189532-1 [Araneus ventricosus]